MRHNINMFNTFAWQMPIGNVAYYIIALGLLWAILVNGANVPGELASASLFKDFSLLEAVFCIKKSLIAATEQLHVRDVCFETLEDCNCDLHWGIVFEGCI